MTSAGALGASLRGPQEAGHRLQMLWKRSGPSVDCLLAPIGRDPHSKGEHLSRRQICRRSALGQFSEATASWSAKCLGNDTRQAHTSGEELIAR
jgi:hypothetical protein